MTAVDPWEATLREPVPAYPDTDPPFAASRLDVRALLIRREQIDRERAALAEDHAAITAAYQARDKRLDRERARIVTACEIGLEALGGRCSFPGIGTAYLTRQAPKIRVEDPTAFRAWAAGRGIFKQYVDEPAAKKAALEQVAETGEIPPGADLVPEHRTLAVRKEAVDAG